MTASSKKTESFESSVGSPVPTWLPLCRVVLCLSSESLSEGEWSNIFAENMKTRKHVDKALFTAMVQLEWVKLRVLKAVLPPPFRLCVYPNADMGNWGSGLLVFVGHFGTPLLVRPKLRLDQYFRELLMQV